MTTQPQHVTDSDFGRTVIQSDRPVLVDFWADWCGPCHAVAPTLEELAEAFAGSATIAKVDVDANPETTRQFGIRSIPTLILFKDGKEQERLIGAQPKSAISALLERHVGLKPAVS